MKFSFRRVAVFACLGSACCVAQGPEPVNVKVQAKPGRLKAASNEEYRTDLARLAGLVDSCRGTPTACDPQAVGPDESVDNGKFEVRWDWLRQALAHAKSPDVKEEDDRDLILDAASDRLTEDALEAANPAPADASGFPDARLKANAILRQREFGHVEQNSWWELKKAAINMAINRFFARIGAMIPQAPWVATAIEWGLLALAAVAVLLWVRRVNQQQRFAIAGAQALPSALWQKESEDWAERARTEAARGDWREAVHCLYWSAIVLLEGQKLWRQNRARTPREYVSLLEPGSARQQALGGLTRVFERIWYGLRPAAEHDYQQASTLLDQLRAP